MSTGSWFQKESLRTQMRQSLQSIAPTELQDDSTEIVRHLQKWPIYIHSGNPLLFVPIFGEPQIQSLLDERFAAQSVVWLPRISAAGLTFCKVRHWDELVRGTFGILEPSADCEILNEQAPDLVLVPGVAFSKSGQRLGRGGGYYDRLIGTLPDSTITLGICFALQILEDLPTEPHDRPVTYGLSQEGFWKA